MEGYVDYLSTWIIRGWILDKNMPDKIIYINIYYSNRLIAGNIPANIFREDLLNCGKGNGIHGFEFDIPSFVLDPLSLVVKTVESEMEIVNLVHI